MKSLVALSLLLLCSLCSPQLGDFATAPPPALPPPSPLQLVAHLDSLLQTLHPSFLSEFIYTFHRNNSTKEFVSLVTGSEGGYFVLVAKMYLYNMLSQPVEPELQQYATQAPHLAAYFYLHVAAHQHSNRQAYYWLGLLEQFKLVPDKALEVQLGQQQRDRAQEALYKHLKQSHLNNGEHNLFMAAAMGHDPASLVLGHMNREAFGTSPNCTSALAYYLAVLKRTLFEPYSPKLVLDLAENMEDHLYARKQLELQEQERDDHSFVMDTAYFDEETISATLEQANRFYTGSRGVLRDLERALKLFEKLSHQGNLDGKIMAGLMYFRGEGTLRDVGKARHLFEQTRKDEVSEYMLIVMDYFEMIGAGTRPRAIRTIRDILKDDPAHKKLSHLMGFFIGAIALKGELTEISQEEAILLVDRSAAEGNPSARVLMAILFADGVKGLKYGCGDATKYLSEDAIYHTYFGSRTNTAEVAMKRGLFAFSFFKNLELILNGYQTAYTNALYLLEIYKDEALGLTPTSWKPSALSSSRIYLFLRHLQLVPDISSYLVQQFNPVGTQALNLNSIDSLLSGNAEYIAEELNYIVKKIVKRGVVNEKKGLLRYYEYKLALAEGESPKEIQKILSTLASGESNKLFVLEARYLLGQLYHQQFLGNSKALTPKNKTKVLGEYSRAVKSEVLGKLIFEIEQWRLTGHFDLSFWDSGMGQDFLSYIFVLAIIVFILYYLRAKRFDHFHKIELEKQLRRAHEEQIQQEEAENKPQQLPNQQENDPDQPIIVEDPPAHPEPQGIRIGSSQEELQ